MKRYCKDASKRIFRNICLCDALIDEDIEDALMSIFYSPQEHKQEIKCIIDELLYNYTLNRDCPDYGFSLINQSNADEIAMEIYFPSLIDFAHCPKFYVVRNKISEIVCDLEIILDHSEYISFDMDYTGIVDNIVDNIYVDQEEIYTWAKKKYFGDEYLVLKDQTHGAEVLKQKESLKNISLFDNFYGGGVKEFKSTGYLYLCQPRIFHINPKKWDLEFIYEDDDEVMNTYRQWE